MLGGDELLDERGIDDRSSLDDPLQRLDELVHVRDAALQQVATALAAGQEFGRPLDLNVSGENDDCRLRELLADGRGGIETFAGMGRRHPDVDDREVGTKLADEVDQPGRGAGLADDLEAGTLEQACQPLAEKNVVVGQHHLRAARAHTADYGVP